MFFVPKHDTNVGIIFYLFTQFKGFLIKFIKLHPPNGGADVVGLHLHRRRRHFVPMTPAYNKESHPYGRDYYLIYYANLNFGQCRIVPTPLIIRCAVQF